MRTAVLLGPQAHDVHVLVVPDRHARADAQDQVAREPRLALGERARARVVDVPRPAAAVPLRGPVGVEVDAAGVLAGAAGVAVGVQVGHDPEVRAGAHALESACDRVAGALVPVDAPHDEHARAARVAGAHHNDRPTVGGAAEQHRPRGPDRRVCCRATERRLPRSGRRRALTTRVDPHPATRATKKRVPIRRAVFTPLAGTTASERRVHGTRYGCWPDPCGIKRLSS